MNQHDDRAQQFFSDPNDPIEERLDPVRRKSYFYNKETNQSGWSREEVASPRERAMSRGSMSRGSFHAGGDTDQAAIAAATQQSFDEASGRAFFFNRITGKSGWSREEVEGGAAPVAPPAVAPGMGDMIEERMDPNRGRPYYFNRLTKKVGWSREEVMDSPGGGMPPPPPAAPPAAVKKDEIKAVKDPTSGRMYYVNMRTQKTGWSPEEVEDDQSDMLQQIKRRTDLDNKKSADMMQVIGGDQNSGEDWIAQMTSHDEATEAIQRAEEEAKNVLKKAKEMARAAKQRAVQEAEQALQHATQLAEDSRNRALVRAERAITRAKTEEERKRQLAQSAKAKYDKTVEAKEAMMRRLQDECMARQEVMEEAKKEYDAAKSAREQVQQKAAEMIEQAKIKCEQSIAEAEAEVFGSQFSKNLFTGKVVMVTKGSDKGSKGRLLLGIKGIEEGERYQVKLLKTGEVKNYGADKLEEGSGNEGESDESEEETGSDEESEEEDDEEEEGEEDGEEEAEEEEEEPPKDERKRSMFGVKKGRKSTKGSVADSKKEAANAKKLAKLNDDNDGGDDDGGDEDASLSAWLTSNDLEKFEDKFEGVETKDELGLFEPVDLELLGIKKIPRNKIMEQNLRDEESFTSMVEAIDGKEFESLADLIEALELGDKCDADKVSDDFDFADLKEEAKNSCANTKKPKDDKDAREAIKEKLGELGDELTEVDKLKILYGLTH